MWVCVCVDAVDAILFNGNVWTLRVTTFFVFALHCFITDDFADNDDVSGGTNDHHLYIFYLNL